jgi:SAM-dependent methyltransferase
MNSLVQLLFHLLCRKDTSIADTYDEDYFRHGFAETTLYFQRLDNRVDFVDKSVLDVGCGYGTTCIYMALHGARKVMGIDIDAHHIQFARTKLCSDYSELVSKVEFKVVTEPRQLGGEKFDIICSKDSFEHIADPQKYLHDLQEYVAEDGIIVIGFGPLWKSPYGGHIHFMTPLPWAHLLFPEQVIMRERRRFRPEESAQTFAEVKGGLNKMTLAKFQAAIKNTSLQPLYLRTNVHQRKLTRLFSVLRHIPWCKEYFTFNIYSIWRCSTSKYIDINVD